MTQFFASVCKKIVQQLGVYVMNYRIDQTCDYLNTVQFLLVILKRNLSIRSFLQIMRPTSFTFFFFLYERHFLFLKPSNR